RRRRLPAVLVRYAVKHNVTRIVLGHSKMSRLQTLLRGSLAGGILRRTRNVDVFVIADRADYDGERVLPTRSAPAESDPYRRLSE
ncbi:hypothetical protein ABTL18_20075, partial [Acinetobacter baumannii]